MGSVFSEVGSTGKKNKTNIYAAGAIIGYQAEWTNASTTTEAVRFEHVEPSGMSSRGTLSNGNPFGGNGVDGGPAEFDPLGSNMGIESTYVEEPEDPDPRDEENPNTPTSGDSQMIVNGWRIPCYVNGMWRPCKHPLK